MAGSRIHVSLERNMQCGVALCGHCQLGPLLLCRDGPVLAARPRRRPPRRPGALSRMARKPRLAVWKFASCDGCQLTLLDCEDELLQIAGEVEIAYFLEATRGTVRGPYDLSLVEGSVTTPHDAERIQRGAARIARARHDRRLRHLGRHPGAAQLRGRRRLPLDRVRDAGLRLDAGHVDADLGARARRLRAAGLPDRQAPAARGAERLPEPARAAHLRAERLRRVQAARQRLRHGRARDAVPRAGHARRLRGDLPVVRPRLLRLLRAQGDARTRPPSRAGARVSARPNGSCTTSSARSTRPVPSSSRRAMRMSPPPDPPPHAHDPHEHARARRGRGRACTCASATASWRPSSCASTSRRASSRRSCAAATSARRPTSPRGSAASARSPTRRAPSTRSRMPAASSSTARCASCAA